MAVTGTLLFLAARGLPHVPCWGLFLVIALIAWPIWHYQQEYALFQRRAVLAGIAPEQSRLRAWFWRGRVTRVLQVFVALLWSVLLVAVVALLGPAQWLVLAADTLVLALIVGPVTRRVAVQVREERLSMVVRRWPLTAINLALLTAGFLVIDFFVAGGPDTRGMAWHAVAERAFTEGAARASCTLAGWLVGAFSAADRLTWHASELLIPGLPDRGFRLAVWALFLLQAGVVAYGFTRLQLGVLALQERRRLRLATLTGEGAFSKAFFLTILVLAVPYLYATWKLRDLDPAALADGVGELASRVDPCRPDTGAIDAIRSDVDARIEAGRVSATQRAAERVDETLDVLFADVEQGVDRYLDWYFTVLGEYERLAALATGGFAELMAGELDRRLFGDAGFAERLDGASRDIEAESEARMGALSEQVGARILDGASAGLCGLGEVDLSGFTDLDRDRMRASAAAGGGVAAGAVTAKLLAKKTGAAVAGKVAAKKGFQAAVSLGGKVAAKKGGSILLSAAGAAAICSPGGPLAALCGVVAGAATWLAFDKAFIEIDEVRFRDEMRAEILDVLAGQRAELAELMKAVHAGMIDASAGRIRGSVERAFVPARDGT